MSNNQEEEEELPLSDKTIAIRYDDLNLDSFEGQNELIIRLERELIENPNITSLDLGIVRTIKDLAKVKKDLETLKLYVEFRERLDKIEKKVKVTKGRH
jgi:capsule polysaccharide export protein KpsE/RkpR